MIWRGSYGESTGASNAITSSARTIRPPMAPRGLRRTNPATARTGAERPCHARRRSGRALPAVVSLSTMSFSPCDITLLVADPGIEHAVEQVNQQVEHQHDRGDEQDDGLNHDKIPVDD